MVLLPSGSFSKGSWPSILSHPDISDEKFHELWEALLHEISITGVGKVTHLAVNEGIPPHKDSQSEGASKDDGENILRSPSGLKILHGGFGPSIQTPNPSPEDFDAAFWVSTKQNGIYQTWAPRYTMFSRGNIKEKARLLDFHRNANEQPKRTLSKPAHHFWAVDLYAGIGYFTFSYAKLGMMVLCWELNPWSVEALRRGAIANGWTVKVIQGAELQLPAQQLLTGDEQIVVFLQDNHQAACRIQEMRSSERWVSTLDNIIHVNGGLLPTSEPIWQAAWDMLPREECRCWAHLHENVGVNDIETRRAEIQHLYDSFAAADPEDRRMAAVEHVELVKTYAPDVWHCVFDVYITSPDSRPDR
ncbi:hypothetical protein Brms1b_003361 [Colletotrichum noveboracense]|nr:hypothetical protein Brms1b_003361 [Colletotrichum noveboracense]